MFKLLVLLITSLIIEIVILIFIPPFTSSGAFNHLTVALFSINTGVMVGTIYSFILIGIYWFSNARYELYARTFMRRAGLFGALVTALLFCKFYGILDLVILIMLIVVFISLEIFITFKEKK